MIKTKIIATLGPSCSNSDIIKAMTDNGVDVFRLNFSHGTLEEHGKLLESLNTARSQHHHTTAVLGDLCGPKIRTNRIEPDGDELHTGEKITIVQGSEVGTAKRFGTNYEHFNKDIAIGHRIFIDDGRIALRVVSKNDNEVVCEVIIAGVMRSHKGINLPDTQISIPSITKRDWQCVDWAIEKKLDFLALSFVRSADEIKQLKDYIRKAGANIKIVAKIETPQVLKHLEDVIKASDAILVARGDLGVEMDLAEVPLIQKRITQLCRRFGKPVVVATQMLQSMIDSPVATRAEVSDVANAIMDLTDAVMLSGETAVGKYPVKAAQTIQRIASVTEAYLDQNELIRPKTITTDDLALTASVAHNAGQIADDIGAKLVAVWSQTGSSARLLSKARIGVPILAFSSDQRTCHQMCLDYGVIPRCQPIPVDIESFTGMVDRLIINRNWANIGEKIVLVAGQPLGTASATNAIIVHTITND
ncbi:MAG: pyruvate kinase [Planctomycetota bacterium]|nr:MAG: pyruvate kinase [Planctomycetota bacterium]